MASTTPRRRRTSTEETVTVADLVGRARTVGLRRAPGDTVPLPVTSAADRRARHRRPGSSEGGSATDGPPSRLVWAGAVVAALSVFALTGGLVFGQAGEGRSQGDVTDGLRVPVEPPAPAVVTVDGVAHPAGTPASSVAPTAPGQAEDPPAESADGPESPDSPGSPRRRSEADAPKPDEDPRERAREAIERRLEEWESRANEIPGVPDW